MTSILAIAYCLTASVISAPIQTPLVEKLPLQAAGFKTFWEANLPIESGDSVESAYLVDEALYVTTDLGDIFALKADVGLLRWGFNLTEPDYRIFKPTHVVQQGDTGSVIFPTVTDIVVFDRFSGEQLQRFRPEFPSGSPAVAFNNNLLLGSSNGKVYSLVFNHPTIDQPFKRWEVMAGGPVTAAPLLYDRGWLLFASQSGRVFSCVAANKKLNWSYNTGGPILAGPAVDPTGIYVASTDRSLYKLDRNTGTPLWRSRFPGALRESPVARGDTVFQYCADNGLTAIDAATGEERWNNAEAVNVASHTEGGDVLFTRDHRIEIVDPKTGDVGASISAPGVQFTIPNNGGDAVYLFGSDGRVLCLRLDDVPFLRRQQVSAARDQLNQTPTNKKPRRVKHEIPNTDDPVGDDPLRSKRDTKKN